MCRLTVTSRDISAQSIFDCFHFHYQAGCSDLVGCTAFADGGDNAPYSRVKPHPDGSLINEPSMYIMISSGLLLGF